MAICGLDECGRGPLAGPIVAAGVVLNSKFLVLGLSLSDSKKLNKNQREKIYHELVKSDCRIETEIISVKQINNRGIEWANKEIFRRLIKKIEADRYIVDGNLRLGRIWGKGNKVKCLVKADATRKCVMAASIVAKVNRDWLMKKLHEKHPQYGWVTNMGYGTRKHVMAITEYGVVKHHRSLFVRTALKTFETKTKSKNYVPRNETGEHREVEVRVYGHQR